MRGPFARSVAAEKNRPPLPLRVAQPSVNQGRIFTNGTRGRSVASLSKWRDLRPGEHRPMPHAPAQMAGIRPPRRNPATNFFGDASSPDDDGRPPPAEICLRNVADQQLYGMPLPITGRLHWRSARATRSFTSPNWPKANGAHCRACWKRTRIGASNCNFELDQF
jgi:hypothetical protein